MIQPKTAAMLEGEFDQHVVFGVAPYALDAANAGRLSDQSMRLLTSNVPGARVAARACRLILRSLPIRIKKHL
jgi:hypothetical protein